VLDRNKIKNVCETSFINQWNLHELHMEENRLRELANINCLENLQRLYLGSNRIQVCILGSLFSFEDLFRVLYYEIIYYADIKNNFYFL